MINSFIIFSDKHCNKVYLLGSVVRHINNNKNMSVESSIREKLTEKLQPVHLNIINESYMHNVPKGSETHFKVVVVSETFKDLPLIKVKNNKMINAVGIINIVLDFQQRHRMVNELLDYELKNGVHALSIVVRVQFVDLQSCLY